MVGQTCQMAEENRGMPRKQLPSCARLGPRGPSQSALRGVRPPSVCISGKLPMKPLWTSKKKRKQNRTKAVCRLPCSHRSDLLLGADVLPGPRSAFLGQAAEQTRQLLPGVGGGSRACLKGRSLS